jgi:hypothetical protein
MLKNGQRIRNKYLWKTAMAASPLVKKSLAHYFILLTLKDKTKQKIYKHAKRYQLV